MKAKNVYYGINILLVIVLWQLLELMTPALQASEFVKSLEKMVEQYPLGPYIVKIIPWQFLFSVFLVKFINRIEIIRTGLESASKWIVDRLQPTEPTFLRMPESRHDPLLFDYHDAIFIGQEDKLEELNAFLKREEPFLWWFIMGPPGIGKSRLALHWIKSLVENPKSFTSRPKYAVGFSYGGFPDETWEPNKPTIIVVDNAGEVPDKILETIERFGQQASRWPHKVRILLLERSIPETLAVLNERSIYYRYRHKEQPLTPNPLERVGTHQLVAELAKKSNQKISADDYDQINRVSEGNPLIATAATLMLLEDGEINWNDRAELLSIWAERMINNFKIQGYPEDCLPLLALSTFTRELSWESAREFLPKAECLKKRLLDRIIFQDTAKHIPGIKPDLFGEIFLLHIVKDLPEDEQKKLVEVAWVSNPTGAVITLYDLIKDFPNHPGLLYLDVVPENAESAAQWGKVRVYLLADQELELIEIDRYWQDLLELRGNFNGHPSIGLTLAQGAVNAVYRYGEGKKWAEMAAAFELLQKTAQAHPDSAEIQLRLAKGLVNLIEGYNTKGNVDELSAAYQRLINLVTQFPDRPEFQLRLARGVECAMRGFFDSERFPDLLITYKTLREVTSQYHDNPDFQFEYGWGLITIAKFYKRQANQTLFEKTCMALGDLLQEWSDYEEFSNLRSEWQTLCSNNPVS